MTKGAEALIATLVEADVDVCFTNPGTSEMHFVAALDAVPRMRAVLGLFEGVVTGAADGYARMAERPAAALLHLGPGLANGVANLHNASRAHSPVVVVVGDHAREHLGLNAPLESDIETVAANPSLWVRRAEAPETIGTDTAAAVQAAIGPPAGVATLIVPADISWLDGAAAGGGTTAGGPVASSAADRTDEVDQLAAMLRAAAQPTLLLGGPVLADPDALDAANRVAHATGARLLAETFPTRLARGGTVVPIHRVQYGTDQAVEQFAGTTDLLLVGARRPVAFFSHPGSPSRLEPKGARIHVAVEPGINGGAVLRALVEALDAPPSPTQGTADRPDRPTGRLDPMSAAATVGALLGEGMIVSDEALTSGLMLPQSTAGAPRHDWLTITGGAIGQGLPVATGAAVACPDSRVLSLQADGSAMYTIQSLWTQAREGLDVTTVIYNNGSYEILSVEMQRVGAAGTGPKAQAMFDLTGPQLDFVAMAKGLGVPATRAETAEDFTDQLEAALATPGPNLVEAMIPRLRDL